MLKDKTAIIYGASPSLGGAVAREMARAGARMFVTNRHLELAEEVARQIRAEGGHAEAARVDALNEESVQSHLDDVMKKAESLDISFNLIGIEVQQDVPLIKMKADDFVRPITLAMHTQFLTATAAGRVMSKQGSGVILSLTATPGGIGYPKVGGFGPVCAGIETFSKNLAAELGPSGVRVVNIRSGGSPDSRAFKQAIAHGGSEIEEALARLKSDTMLKAMPMMSDIASISVFLASDLARRITGTTIDVTVGTTAALNYATGN